MNIMNQFPSKYLRSADIPDGEDLIGTISEVTIEEIQGRGDSEADSKPAVHFEEEGMRPLLLNKTNADAISRMYTPETENWIGKKIAMFATEVDFGGKMTMSIRVRLKPPQQKRNSAQQPAPSAKPTNAAPLTLYQVPANADGILVAIGEHLKTFTDGNTVAPDSKIDPKRDAALIDAYRAAKAQVEKRGMVMEREWIVTGAQSIRAGVTATNEMLRAGVEHDDPDSVYESASADIGDGDNLPF